MKEQKIQDVRDYKIYLFGRENGDYEWASREQGQKIIMALASQNPPKFITIGNNIINTSAISSIVQMDIGQLREISAQEKDTQDKFSVFKLSNVLNNKLLN